MATVQLAKAAIRKLRMAAGPASSMAAPEPRRSPVPMEPPTATMAICPAESWWRRPSSLMRTVLVCGGEGSKGMQEDSKSGARWCNEGGAEVDGATDSKLFY